MDHESVQATAMKVVFDLLHMFGFESFSMNDGAADKGKGDNDEAEVVYLYIRMLTLCICNSELLSAVRDWMKYLFSL